MKLTVKTLKGSHFEIKIQPHDTIMAVKKSIEAVQGKNTYPCGQQLLIHNGKVLKDETTLEENKVNEDGFLVVMLSKSRNSGATGSSHIQASAPAPVPVPAPAPESTSQAPFHSSTTDQIVEPDLHAAYMHQLAPYSVPGSDLEHTVQMLTEMGGGFWDKETAIRALHAACDSPRRASNYLYSGSTPTSLFDIIQARAAAAVSEIPNSLPLDLFPQGTRSLESNLGEGTLDFLRDNRQFQQLRAMVQANPHILQPMLQELGKQNPQLLSLIQEHHAEFLQLLNEPNEGVEGDVFNQGDQEKPHAVSVTAEEQEAVARLEAMGFERSLVIEAFLACDRNEELAANYLVERGGEEN